ncbi:phage tail sheath family protein [Streptomyces sp. NPDC058308]|uniref:phage tail sheath family protein n=1 Tax=Streptomyces sp. NPDC058308 TaxID=3346440 RepID=UPI0036EE1554
MSPQQPHQPRTAGATGPFGPDTGREAGHGAPVIHGVPTAVAAFVGDARSLPEKPAYVRHPQEFIEAFSTRGTDDEALSHVHDAVLGHFRNGGGGAWLLGTAGGGDRVAAYRAALARLEKLVEVTLVVTPDLWRVESDAHAIARAVAEHCGRLGNRVALLHTRQGIAPADVRRPFELAEPEAQFVAVHYPWITVTAADGTERLVPPSGHASGLCCRVDIERGVHTAPVGALVGVVKQEWEMSADERETINDLGVNCLRFVPGRGIRVTGARTLSTEPDWADLGVRRLVNHARASLAQGTRWAAFETDTAQLRALVRQSAVTFLRGLWRRGALRGGSAAEAFEVVCEKGTAGGRLALGIGLAAVRPAEFITFRIEHPAENRVP